MKVWVTGATEPLTWTFGLLVSIVLCAMVYSMIATAVRGRRPK